MRVLLENLKSGLAKGSQASNPAVIKQKPYENRTRSKTIPFEQNAAAMAMQDTYVPGPP